MPKIEDEEKSSERSEEGKSDQYNLRTDEEGVSTPFMGKRGAPKAESLTKRTSKWISFARQHSAFGFDKLTNAQLPLMSQKTHGFAICLEKIHGWRVPKSLQSDLNRGYCDVTVHLSLSLFHMKSLTFFGTTWTGREVLLSDSKVPDIKDVDYVDILYFISRLMDSSCIGIVEVVATRIDKETNLATAQYGCGWAMISLFGQQVLHDIAEGHSHVTTTTATFYKGSPRDILELSLNDHGKKSVLQEISGCLLYFKVYSHRKLLRLSDLVVENAIFGRYDIIAGLSTKKVTSSFSKLPSDVPCIGDSESDDKAGVICLPGTPSVARSYMAKVTNWQLFIPNRSSFESAIRIRVGQGISCPDSSRPQIISRIVKIGYHNGHTVLSGSFQEYSLEEDETDADTLKISDGTVELNGYVAHELFALVITIEYTIGFANYRDLQHSFKTIQTSSNKSSDEIATVSIGTSIFVPFSEGRILLRHGLMDTDGGSDFDVELDVLTDSSCSIISPNKVFKTSDYLTNPDDDDLPKVGFDLKMFDWHDREIFHNHEADQSAIAPDDGDDAVSTSSDDLLPANPSLPRSSSDTESSSDRIDEKRPLRTSMKLDQEYYTTKRTVKESEVAPVSTDNVAHTSSLMARSLKMKLGGDQETESLGDFLNESKSRNHQSSHRRPVVESTKELSRASKARLSRHGFRSGGSGSKSTFIGHGLSSGMDHLNVDIDLESRDRLSLNEVTIQIAGYRTGTALKNPDDNSIARRPRAIYCSYQFYSCTHTRTEPLRILPSELGEIGVLVRDDAHHRNETPLAIRHSVNCSDVSPHEAFEFASYLGHRTLYIDVWDADSLLLVGTCAVPLRKLMRQGQESVKCAIECDIVYCESCSIEGGTACMNVISNGPLVGSVMGSLNIILGNSGREGRSAFVAEAKDTVGADLNWRVGVESFKSSPTRSKNQVRAKPLSESQPKLSKILSEHRNTTGSVAPLRSLLSSRANDNQNTITYDELSRLFKRFQGAAKGTIQYTGALMNLLQVPSLEAAKIKFVKAVTKLKRSGGSLKSEVSKLSDASDNVPTDHVKEFIRRITSSVGVKIRDVEIDVLSAKYTEAGAEINSSKLLGTIEKELAIYDWALVEKRFKSAFQQASLSGTDFQQVFSEFDTKADGFVSTFSFETVLRSLSPYTKFTAPEVSTIIHFFAHCGDGRSTPGFISIKSIMSHIGKEYAGNIRSRLLRSLKSGRDENSFNARFFATLNAKGKNPTRDALSIDDVEEAFHDVGVYEELSRSQVKPIILNILETHEGITAAGFSLELGLSGDGSKSPADVEALLKVIISRVKEKGVDVEATFRHFDSDGNGSLTKEELEEGLSRLQIFDNIPNWRSEVPGLVNKFDTSSDGGVSIKEFLSYVGIKDYSPNIIQKMTKIFAIAQDQLTIEDIFRELDHDSDGFVTASELQVGLKALGSFGDISLDDAAAVVTTFDQDGEAGRISRSQFIEFFVTRIKQLDVDKSRKKSEKLIQRFRNLMKLSIDKGLKPVDIFKHFDKDGGGTISVTEFTKAVKSLPHFASFTDADIQGLVEVIDSDNSGDVSLQEFKQFVVRNSSNVVNRDPSTSIMRVKEFFVRAELNGSSEEVLFSHLDRNRNGRLSVNEFESGMRKLPHFENFSRELLQELIVMLDRNMDGEISLDEFRRFLRESSVPKMDQERNGSNTRDLFTRHLRRISASDGGLCGLLAYLDGDGTGYVSSETFYRLLSREDVYETLSESECETLLRPITRDGSIDLTLLLRLVEDSSFDPSEKNDPSIVPTVIQEDYEFSENPEIRATEKKLRTVGRILATAGKNVEDMFRKNDPTGSGMIRRSDFIEILSRSGMYILEKGDKKNDNVVDDISNVQRLQVQKLKGRVDPSRLAERYVDHDSKSSHEFQEHQESIALINWYRQGQKRAMLKNVLTHSLSTSLSIYPQFAKTVFFESEVRNPFDHEEFFIIEISDPELQVVTNFAEWIHLRRHVRPMSPDIGSEPTDPDTFDQDGLGNIHFALLPHETMHLPFKFLSLIPTLASKSKLKSTKSDNKEQSKSDEYSPGKDGAPLRTAEIRIISGTHGHVVSIVNVHIHPRPFSVDRTLRFFESESSMMKRRINLMGPRHSGNTSPNFIHCVENGKENRVFVEFENHSDSGVEAVEMNIMYRCLPFPGAGSFYILVFKDMFHAEVGNIWFVVVQSRLKLDVHTAVGSSMPVDLVVRGDSFNRRVQAFSSSPDTLSFEPSAVMKLAPKVYNRIIARFSPSSIGSNRIMHINLVDVDTAELVCSWILIASATSPVLSREYDVQINEVSPIHKKVTFQNPFDLKRRLYLASSDIVVMKPRDNFVDVPPHGTAVLRLWFGKAALKGSSRKQVFLFLNDGSGQGEECLLFNVTTVC